MWDLIKIILGAATATAVFVIGQFVLKLVIEPIHEQRRTIGRIIQNLTYYANVYMNPELSSDEQRGEARQALRRDSSELGAWTRTIPWYSRWERLGIVRPESDIALACDHLIGLSNAHDTRHLDDHLRLIEKGLGIGRIN